MGYCLYCGEEFIDEERYREAGGCCKEINGYVENWMVDETNPNNKTTPTRSPINEWNN
jgi:hypothetical protein